MDQLKTIVAQVKKHHFWVLCGIAVVVPLGLTFTAGGQISKNTKARATEAEKVRTQVKQVKDTSNPPNESSKQVVAKAHDGLRDVVYDAWEALYQEQAKRKQWPSALGAEFLSHIRVLKENDPIEDADRFNYQYFIKKHIPKLFLDDNDGGLGLSVRLTQEERKEYLALVRGAPKPQRKKPPAAADAKPDPNDPAAKSSPKSDAGTAQAAGAEELQGIVDWDYTRRQELENRYWWDRPPTSSQVWLAQEDLWVLEALVRILRDTNKNATSQYNAPVKAIYALAIGQEAANDMANSQARIFQSYGLGSGTAPGYGPAGPAGSPLPGGMPMAPGGPMGSPPGGFTRPPGGPAGAIPATPSGAGRGSGDMGDAAGAGMGRFPGGHGPMPMGASGPGGLGGQASGIAMAGLSEDEQWAMTLRNFKYVDQNGTPLPYNATPPFKQFKMIPVHMVLGIDQRELPRLLANCANSDMPVVVRRVAIHPEEGGSGSLSGSSGGVTGSGSSDSGRPKMQMPGPAGGGVKRGGDYGKNRSRGRGPSGPYGAGAAMADEVSDEIVVEIQGIVYFFNPPPAKTVALATGAVSPTQPAPAPSPAPGAGVPAAKP